MSVYFDLCSEQYKLQLNEHLDGKVCKELSEGNEYTFNKDGRFYKDFPKWIYGIYPEL